MSRAYLELFFRHISRFLREHHPGFSRQVVVAVSGGRDSLCLMNVAAHLRSQGLLSEVRVLTVHHGTRAGVDAEVAQVCADAALLGLPCEVLRIEQAAPTANVEAVLRQLRHELLKGALRPQEELWMGHHLDDSWEWAQLSAARSAATRSALGIPLKNGPVLRPFMCVTRAQITRAAQALHLVWAEDPSNHDHRFERNWLRGQVTPLWEKRHPGYLRHYARRSQRLAETMGQALRPTTESQVFLHAQGALVQGRLKTQEWARLVARFSGVTRGRLAHELEKILRLPGEGRAGPFRLAGGVKLYAWEEWKLLVPKAHQFNDESLYARRMETPKWREYTREDFRRAIQQRCQQPAVLALAPLWVAYDSEQRSRNILIPTGRDAAWPKTTSAVCETPIISAFKLLRRWKDPRVRLRLALLWD